jgi:serine/threonine protein kinase
MNRRPPRPAKIGSKLGPYLTVLGVIDGGSEEPVYIVWHHESWCPMACKVMQSWERAEREAGVLGAMAHPYIVPVSGILRPGYLLMPFLEGSSLADLLDKAPRKWLGVSDALRVAVHVGSALNHAHGRGYVHLDVKPDNIIVTPGGRPVLFDFGTARRIAAPRPAGVKGTDGYISPEECSLGHPGPAADVFSLGVMLYEMLAGERPYPKGSAENPFPQVSLEPAPLRARRRGVPAKLENLIFACLERDPAYRPELAELLPALNAMITRGPRMWPDNFRPERAALRSACPADAIQGADNAVAGPGSSALN